jgi:ubiquinone biosynthesis protein
VPKREAVQGNHCARRDAGSILCASQVDVKPSSQLALPDPRLIEGFLRSARTEQLQSALAMFWPPQAGREEKIARIEAALASAAGQALREAMARWIVEQIVPVERLVPPNYLKWRPPVRDAMTFVVAHLSARRLAPKLLEQLELPASATPEARLLLLIAKVPGLQKLGQVIARNRHLTPALRNALAKLENGIRDVQPADMVAIIRRDLGPRLEEFEVRIAPAILSEASVSAVVRFSWRNPENGRRERGVFKVLKPHIPECFADDMAYLHDLAHYFSLRYRDYGFPRHLIPDTFKKVRRLLQHEVNFRREQQTLREAHMLYRGMKGVRIPRPIAPLCTPAITAMSEESGVKVTSAVVRMTTARRKQVAAQLMETLVAMPLFSAEPAAVFHGDPHAGNLLYNPRTGDLVIVDWALRERLTREQRRHLALLFLTVGLRDPMGAVNEVRALAQRATRRQARQMRETVSGFLDELPVRRIPSGADAMLLLERVALDGVRFPAPLIMLSKVLLTLDGILSDIAGPDIGLNLAIMRQLAKRWLDHRAAFRSPVRARDLLALQSSALLFGGRLWVQMEQALVDRLLPGR